MRKKILFAVMALLTMATGNVWGQDKYYTPYVVYNNGTLYFFCDEHADLTEITIDGNTIPLTTAMVYGRNCWTGTEVTNSGSNFPMWHRSLKETVKRVVIEESFKNAEITSCCRWFDGDEYGNLTSLDLSNLNTSKVTNMACMFDGRRGLTSLDLSNFDTSNVTNMEAMFNECNNLTSLDLSNFNTSKVTDMSQMFSGCESLLSLNISHFDTSNVTDMENMFYGCNSLTSLDLSNFNTSKVTDMSSMFSHCRSLTSLDLSSFDTSNVINMACMFNSCSSLTSLDLSSFNTSNVTNMAIMFGYCSSLTSLDLSSFDTSNVTKMESMFVYCGSLTSLDLSSFDTSNVINMANMFCMYYMFNSCCSLTSLDLSSFDTSNVTNMEGMFGHCNSLTSLDLSSFNTSNVINMGGMFGYCRSLTSLDLSSFDTSNVINMEGMFEGCRSLTSLDLSSFDTSNLTGMNEMFYRCNSLTSLDLSSFDTSNVVHMERMFCDCSSLTSLDLSSFDTSNLANMREMFNGCSSLTSLDFSNFNTSNVSSGDMDDTFNNCSSLRLVDLSKATMPNFSELEGHFGNSRLTYVPEGTTVTEGKTNIVVGKDCEHFVIDNNQLLLSIPYGFTAKKITVNRNFTAEKPHTLCLPFAVDAKAYGTFYAYKEYDESGKGVTFNALGGTEATTANRPYLFMPAETLESGIVIDIPTEIAAYTAETSADREFIGIYKKKTFTGEEASEGVYYGWADGEFKRAGEGASVDACRACLRLSASSANRAPARLSVDLGGSATGISSAESGADGDRNAPVYNLQGQRVGGSYKGVMIRNGKKMIIK